MQAICHGLLAHEREIRVVYLTCETFVNQFIAAIEAGKLEDFRQRYRRVDVLLVDDVQFLARKERTQEEFFHTFNTLHENRRQIVLSSDCSPKEIPNLEQRLVSRFKMGLVAQLHPPDFETRVAIVKKKSRLKGTELGHEVAALIAARITSNIRELEGAVTKVLGYGTLLGRDIDLDLAREALYDGVRGETPRIGCDRIIELTAAHFGIGKTELQSRRRTKSIVHPRQVGMFLARKLTRHSLHEIGTFFGNRDHSTVLHAADKIGRALADGDEELKSHVAQLEALLKGDR
jgi:chromosomal replication initiator protein